jgi:hypothetical protein
MINYQLYAHILRLHHESDVVSSDLPLMILRNANDMKRIIVEVIFTDPDLVWC